MEPVRIRPDVDPNSPEYKRALYKIVFILFVLMVGGGSCLGYRIRQMEELERARQEAEGSGETEAEAEAEAASNPNSAGRYRWKSSDPKSGK